MFVTKHVAHQLGEGITIESAVGLGVGHADYRTGGMFEAGQAVYSQGSASLVHTARDSSTTRLTLKQPLRAETGTGRLHYPTGRRANAAGEHLYASQTVSLVPSGRELRIALRHEHPAGRGRWLLEAGHAANTGHRRNGAHENRIFAAYRLRW